MSFSWVDFCELAEEMASTGKSEREFRTSMSRSYYGALCTCRNQKLLTTKGLGSHRNVIEAFKSSDYGEDFVVGTILESLKVKREWADYVIHPPVYQRDAMIAAEMTKQLLENFEATYF